MPDNPIYGIRPVKSLGQNFLTDNNIAEKIVGAAEIKKTDLIIEIGPGTGSLTGRIAALAGRLVAVEIDKNLMPVLKSRLENFDNFEIINSDILKLDIAGDILCRYPGYPSYKVIANLPYYITTPIMMKFIECETPPGRMTFMMQKEVADRIKAGPGSKAYGSLSVFAGYHCIVTKVMDVSPNCFYPRPEVTSTVLNMDYRTKDKANIIQENLFFTIVKAAFAQRRKKVSNSIANTSGLDIRRGQLEGILMDMGLRADARAESLSIENFADLSNRISKLEPDK
ncbi:MAG: 16S rRNA (adenine(1518)-N(6)/adenine(1519)-N(6))-dimethyltransferase RsmA [Clostridia bacterium]|nr:16S rRNA (adenine(1518)-N(6)/adenine(1519)-N(6))-dimethyltransferase RsmA [Clostridia bacterium]